VDAIALDAVAGDRCEPTPSPVDLATDALGRSLDERDLRLAAWRAGWWATRCSIDGGDLRSIANVGLVGAAARFDRRRGMKFRTFAVGVIDREICREIRRYKKWDRAIGDARVGWSDAADGGLLGIESDGGFIEILGAMLSALDDRAREVVRLRAVEGVSFGEIASRVGGSASTASRVYRRATERMRTLSRSMGIEAGDAAC